MIARLTLGDAGRVEIPKRLRDELRLQHGDELDLEMSGEQMTLRPVRFSQPQTREQGVWVLRTGQPLPTSATDDAFRSVREEGDRRDDPGNTR